MQAIWWQIAGGVREGRRLMSNGGAREGSAGAGIFINKRKLNTENTAETGGCWKGAELPKTAVGLVRGVRGSTVNTVL